MEIVRQIQCLLKEKICSEKTEVGVKGGRGDRQKEKKTEKEKREREQHTLWRWFKSLVRRQSFQASSNQPSCFVQP